MEDIRNSVLVVDDDTMNLRALIEILSEDYTVYAERNGKNCLTAARRIMPDLILLDVVMPDMNGFEVIKELKEDEKTKNIPIIFVTGLADQNDEVVGFNLGAVDYIVKPFSSHVVKKRVKHQMRIIDLSREVMCLNMTDTLTGIGNRCFFNALLEHEWASARRQRSNICFMILDIDNFRKFNDTFGYLSGDAVLQEVARIIDSKTGRATDRVARWGGERFAVVLPQTELSGALSVAENIRSTIEDTVIKLDLGSTCQVTVSIGVHNHIPQRTENYTVADFVSDTDIALGKAKKSGKNRVCTYRD